jgi:RNA polymerase-binding transcription factor DksA
MKDHTQVLEAQLRDLTEELKSVGIHNPDNAADWIAVPEGVDANQSDTDLLADVVEEWDGRQALVATLERRWNDINRALAKIGNGTFGTCEVCATSIEADRLDANPAARTCKAHMNDDSTLPQ